MKVGCREALREFSRITISTKLPCLCFFEARLDSRARDFPTPRFIDDKAAVVPIPFFSGASEPETNSSWSDRLKRWRETGTALFAFAYAVGYGSRAIHALENNLGAVSAARLEYLLAGALVILGATPVPLGLWALGQGAKRLAAWARDHSKETQYIIAAVILFPTAGLFAAGAMPDRLAWVRTGIMVLVAADVLFLVLFSAATASSTEPNPHAEAGESTTLEKPTSSRLGKIADTCGRMMIQAWGMVIVAFLALQIVLMFILCLGLGAQAVTYLPQEIGGAKPKCGVFDLVRTELSPELQGMLADSTAITSNAMGVFRSVRLEVYSSSEPWLVRLPDTTPRRASVRIHSSAVRSIEWCR